MEELLGAVSPTLDPSCKSSPIITVTMIMTMIIISMIIMIMTIMTMIITMIKHGDLHSVVHGLVKVVDEWGEVAVVVATPLDGEWS